MNQENILGFQEIVEKDTGAVIVTNLESTVIFSNPAAKKIFGKDILNEKFAYPIIAGETTSIDIIYKDNKKIIAQMDVEKIQWLGQPAHLIFLRDITKQKYWEEGMLQSQKIETVGRLAGGISHEFNNLLMVITNYASLCRDSLKPDNPMREDIEEILKAAQRAGNLTRQLLTFSRLHAVEMHLLNLNDIISSMEKMLRRVIREDVEFVTVLESNLGIVEADAALLGQVIINLVINARDAIPASGKIFIETANVKLDEEYARQHNGVAPGEYIMFAVSDTGSGMNEQTKLHLFEPFYTTKELGKGVGLGLAAVYGIVKQHQGYISVYSEANKGTSFKIYFPRINEKTGKPMERTEMNNLPIGKEKILIAEDEPLVRAVAVRILSKLGYAVLEASNGQEALAIINERFREINLLLVDVVMPHMGGEALVEEVKKIYPELKVIFTSGYTDSVVIHQGIVKKEIAFIPKPFTAAVLANKVRDILDKN